MAERLSTAEAARILKVSAQRMPAFERYLHPSWNPLLGTLSYDPERVRAFAAQRLEKAEKRAKELEAWGCYRIEHVAVILGMPVARLAQLAGRKIFYAGAGIKLLGRPTIEKLAGSHEARKILQARRARKAGDL